MHADTQSYGENIAYQSGFSFKNFKGFGGLATCRAGTQQ